MERLIMSVKKSRFVEEADLVSLFNAVAPWTNMLTVFIVNFLVLDGHKWVAKKVRTRGAGKLNDVRVDFTPKRLRIGGKYVYAGIERSQLGGSLAVTLTEGHPKTDRTVDNPLTKKYLLNIDGLTPKELKSEIPRKLASFANRFMKELNAKHKAEKMTKVHSKRVNRLAKKETASVSVELATSQGKRDFATGAHRLAKILGFRLGLKNIKVAHLDKLGGGRFSLNLFIPEYTPEFEGKVKKIPSTMRKLLGVDIGKGKPKPADNKGVIVTVKIDSSAVSKIMGSAFGKKDVMAMEVQQRRAQQEAVHAADEKILRAAANIASVTGDREVETALRIGKFGSTKLKGSKRKSAQIVADFVKALSVMGFKKHKGEFDSDSAKHKTEKKKIDVEHRAKKGKRGGRYDRGGFNELIMVRKYGKTMVGIIFVNFRAKTPTYDVRFQPLKDGLPTGKFLSLSDKSSSYGADVPVTEEGYDALRVRLTKFAKYAAGRLRLTKYSDEASVEIAKRPMSEDEMRNELIIDTKKKLKKQHKGLEKLKPGVTGEVFKGGNEVKAFVKSLKAGFQPSSDMSSSEISFFLPEHKDISFTVKRDGGEYEAAMRVQMTKTIKDDNWMLDASASHSSAVGAVALMFQQAAGIISQRRKEFNTDFGGRVYWGSNKKKLDKLAAPYTKKSSNKPASEAYGPEHEDDGE